jgi:hypothetical protein
MNSPFWSLFLPCLVTIALAHAIRWFFLPPHRRHVGAIVLESLSFAFALSSHELIFERWPELRASSHFLVIGLSVAVIWIPCSLVADALRDRRAKLKQG